MKSKWHDFRLIVAILFLSISFYIFIVWYAIVHYTAKADYALFIPSQRFLAPEIEIPLYVTGLVLFLILLLPLYRIMRKLLLKYPLKTEELITASFVRLAVLNALLVYFFSLNIGRFAHSKTVFAAYLLLSGLEILIHFVLPRLFKGILHFLPSIFDALAGTVLTLVNLYLVISLAFSLNFKKELIQRLGDYQFGYLDIPFPLFLAVLLGSFLFLFFISAGNKFGSVIIKTLRKYKTWLVLFIFLLICGLLLIVSEHKNTDFSYYIGPINDILGGKTLLSDSTSRYGLLNIYILSAVFKFLPLSYNNFFWLNFLLTAVMYLLIFIILKKWLKSWLISLFGLILILEQYHFVLIAPLLFYPQAGVLRFGMFPLLLLFILFKKNQPQTKKIVILEKILLGTAVFWGFETGLYIFGAFMFYQLVISFSENRFQKSTIGKAFKLILSNLITVIFFWIVISLATFFRAHSWPQWQLFASDAFLFARGYEIVALSPVGPYTVFILIYLLVLSYIFYCLINGMKKEKEDLGIPAFISMYGAGQFIYYLGRSHPNNIHYVTVPFILIICWILKKITSFYRPGIFLKLNNPLKFMAVNGVLLVTIWFSVIFSAGLLRVREIFNNRSKSLAGIDELYQTKEINQAVDNLSGNPAIISRIDTYLLTQSATVNSIDSNNLPYFVTFPQLDRLGQQLLDRDPEEVFIDHIVDSDQVSYLKKYLEKEYQFEDRAGYLDKWVRRSKR